MATHSSILAWEIPWTEKPGRLQSLRLHNVAAKQQQSRYKHRSRYSSRSIDAVRTLDLILAHRKLLLLLPLMVMSFQDKRQCCVVERVHVGFGGNDLRHGSVTYRRALVKWPL